MHVRSFLSLIPIRNYFFFQFFAPSIALCLSCSVFRVRSFLHADLPVVLQFRAYAWVGEKKRKARENTNKTLKRNNNKDNEKHKDLTPST